MMPSLDKKNQNYMIRASKALFSKVGVVNSIACRKIRSFRDENVPDSTRFLPGYPFDTRVITCLPH